MQSVRFVNGARAGFRYFQAGQVAGIPDTEAVRLIAAGEAEPVSPAASFVEDEEADEEAETPAAASITRRVRKPARRRRRKG